MFKGLGALAGLMGNKGKIAEEMQKFQETLGTLTAEGVAGAATVTANGRMEILAVRFAPTTGDLAGDTRDAANEALRKVRELVARETAKMAENMGLPAGMLGGLPGLG